MSETAPPAERSSAGGTVLYQVSEGTVDAAHGDLAGEHMLLAVVGADNKTALLVYIHSLACSLPAVRQVKGHPPSDVDTGGLVLLPERCKAIPRKGVQGPIKAEIRQSLGQPAGILLQIDRGTCRASEVPWGRSAASK